MCVFISMRADQAKIQKRFESTFVEEENFRPRYVQSAFEFPSWPAILAESPGQIRLVNWGLVPHWIRDAESARKFRVNTVNARAETIFEKPAFRKAALGGHCLILADGFFEFREEKGIKYPYYIRLREGIPFAMAGLYEHWKNPETGELTTGFSIITTEANPLMARIHNRKKRMPVILPAESERDWLQPGRRGEATLLAYDERDMEAWTVSRRISERKNQVNAVELLEPVDYLELTNSPPEQGSLF